MKFSVLRRYAFSKLFVRFPILYDDILNLFSGFLRHAESIYEQIFFDDELRALNQLREPATDFIFDFFGVKAFLKSNQ